jgi:hypothetical protein
VYDIGENKLFSTPCILKDVVARVRAVPVDRYEQWVDRQRRNIDAANQAAAKDRTRFQPIPSP